MIRGILLVIGVIILIILIIFLVDQFLLNSTLGKKITNNPCLELVEIDCKIDNMCEPQYKEINTATNEYIACDQKSDWSLFVNWISSKKLKKAF